MTITIQYSRIIKKLAQNWVYYLLLIVFTLSSTCCDAQLNLFQSIYYQNRYLNNPAMAGLDAGLNINLGYQQQWNAFPGEPQAESLTTEYQATDKVGVGVNVIDEQSGIFRQTRIMASYAYHVPLSDDNQKLNFGLSAGINDSRINYSVVNGDLTDNVLVQYNQVKPNVDGDFGISYTSDSFFAEAVLPNLSTTIFNWKGQEDDVDRTVFFAAMSYKFDLSDQTGPFSLEPLVGYRQVKGFTSIVDLGINFKMNDYHLALQGLYHTNDNYALAIIFQQPNYAFSFSYNIYAGPITNYSNGSFEVGIKLNLSLKDNSEIKF